MDRLPYFKYVTLVLACMLFPLWLFAKFPPTNYNTIPLLKQSAIIDTTICEGNCVVFDNISYCEEGTYILNNSNVLKVNLMPTVQQTSLTICEGETYPNQDWTTTGRYNYQTSVGACEITVWVDLSVAQPKETFISQEISYGECYDFGPNTLCQTGEYELRYLSAEGCDSTVYINLVVEELLIDTLPSVSVCSGESYSPIGFDTTLTESGLYQFYGETSEGRPTLSILDFQVKGKIITNLEKFTCEGTPFIHDGQILEESKVYEFNYTAFDGCDSLVLIDLTIGAVTTTNLNETINSDAFIVIGNNVVNLEGSYEFVFTSSVGCDSIVQLNLAIAGTPDSLMIEDATLEEEVCSGIVTRNICLKDLPFEIGPNTFWQGGIFELTYLAPDGCTNDFDLDLTVERKITSLKEKICEGSSYTMNGVNYTQTGIYADTLIGVTGNNCDSIIYLDLTIMFPKETSVAKSICWGEPLMINGDFVTESGTYIERFRTTEGCDSLVTINLTVEGGPNLAVEKMNLCAGESYADDIGNKVFVSGLYNFKFISEDGCDSIVTLDLLIPDTIRLEVDTFFCDGENFDFENFSVTRSGIYREKFKSAGDCDSIVQYTLTALDCEIGSIQNADTIICGGNTGEFSFMLIKGQAPFSYQWASESGLRNGEGVDLNLQEEVIEEGLPSGTYGITVTDRNGQEAVLEIEIFRPEIITAVWEISPLIGADHLACYGDSTAFLQIMPAGGLPPYRYQWSNGVSGTNRIENLSAGTYTVTITDDFNCPYISTEEIRQPPALTFIAESEDPLCEDLASGLISISEVAGGKEPYEFQLEGFTQFSNEMNFQNLAEGTYKIVTRDSNNCQVDTTLTIVAPEVITLDYAEDILIKLGEQYDLDISSSGVPQTISWEEIEGISCTDCLEVTLSPVVSSIYTLTVTSLDNCSTTVQLNVNVSKDRYIFIPNVFSPNLDGLNDGFTVFGGPSIANVEVLQIFSRWGELLFETNNLELNNELKGWDGYHNGRKMNPGVYVWMAKVTFIDGETKVYSGDVLLAE